MCMGYIWQVGQYTLKLCTRGFILAVPNAVENRDAKGKVTSVLVTLLTELSWFKMYYNVM